MKSSDDDIDFSDIPELNEEFLANAELILPPHQTRRIKLSIGIESLEWIDENAKKRGVTRETIINGILMSYVQDKKNSQ